MGRVRRRRHMLISLKLATVLALLCPAHLSIHSPVCATRFQKRGKLNPSAAHVKYFILCCACTQFTFTSSASRLFVLLLALRPASRPAFCFQLLHHPPFAINMADEKPTAPLPARESDSSHNEKKIGATTDHADIPDPDAHLGEAERKAIVCSPMTHHFSV